MLKCQNNIKKYDKYKDSSIEWIGEIPEGWRIQKIKYSAEIFTGNSINDSEKGNYEVQENAIPYIATKNIEAGTNKIDYDNGVYIPTSSEFKVAPANSVLLCIEGGSAGRKIGFSDKAVCFVNKLCCFMAKNGFSAKLLYYLCQSDVFLTDFYLKMSGLIGGVSTGQIKNINVIFPIPEEQDMIANYLDKECGLIDEVIKKEKSIIEKLKEYKQSIITEAVMQGLNKNVESKATGVEYLKNIPQHWKLRRIKYLLLPLQRKLLNDDDVITCFRNGTVTLRKNIREEGYTFSDTEHGYQGVEPDDLVIHGMDGFAGAIGISDSRGKISPVVHVCASLENKKYYMYFLRALAMNDVFMALSDGVRIRSSDFRNWEKLAKIIVANPPINEQQQIADFISQKCKAIEKTIATKETLIEKLTEYKKSLIYECVTGKRKVAE